MKKYLLAPILLITTSSFADMTYLQSQINQTNVAVQNKLKNDFTNQFQIALKTALQKRAKQQNEILANLQAHLNSLQAPSSFKGMQNEAIRRMMQKNILLQNTTESVINTMPEIHLLKAHLLDAYEILETMRSSVAHTQEALQSMYRLSQQAASQILTDEQIDSLDAEFQSYKKRIEISQTASLLSGEKKVGGGDLYIQFGTETVETSLFAVKVPAYNIAALGITDLNLKHPELGSVQSKLLEAMNSVAASQTALIRSNAIDDAETMLLSVPAILNQNYALLAESKATSLAALSYLDPTDSPSLNTYFDYLKQALDQNQTYTSINGPKKLGGGNIHIQIGSITSPSTTLEIPLPITDEKKLGMNELNLKTAESSVFAYDTMGKILRNFMYVPVSV